MVREVKFNVKGGMLFYISIIGLVVAFLLAFFNRNRFAGNYYLVGFFLVNSLFGLTFYALYYSPSVVFSAVMHGHFMPVLYLAGPLAYFYVRSLVTDDSRLKWRDLVHAIPFIILFAGIIPYYLKDFSYKEALNASFRVDASNFMTNINVLVPQSINLISRPIIVMAYFVASLWLFVRNRKIIHEKTLLSGLDFNHVFTFVLALLILSLLLSAGFFIFIVENVLRLTSHNSLPEMKLLLTIIGWIYFLLNSSLFVFPEILYGLPRFRGQQPNPGPKPETTPDQVSNLLTEKIVSRSQFSDDYLSKMEQQILDYVKHKAFLDLEFNLTMMSAHTNIPSHHLSYYFNNVLMESFSEWRNRLRIEHSLQLIKDGYAKDHSLNAVSLDSGFSSQVTFIRAFKNHTGQTPSEHLKLVN